MSNLETGGPENHGIRPWTPTLEQEAYIKEVERRYEEGDPTLKVYTLAELKQRVDCLSHPADEDLFKRAILRAIPAVKSQLVAGREDSIGVFFPIGSKEYGLETILSCAKSIVEGQCQRFEYIETNALPSLSFEIKARSE